MITLTVASAWRRPQAVRRKPSLFARRSWPLRNMPSKVIRCLGSSTRISATSPTVVNGKFFCIEGAAIRHIFAISIAYGMWPGYVRVDGGFMTTCEPDELALIVSADDGDPD